MIGPNSTKRVKTDVYRYLKDRIQYLDMMPGQVIREQELIDSLGISRTPVRETLIRLSSEYLVDIYPQRGTYVSEINFDIATECTYIRHELDMDVCMRLCDEKRDLTFDVDECLFFQKKAVREKNVVEYIKNDNNFHAAIFKVAGHEMTWEIISDSRAHYNRMLVLDLRRPGVLEKSLKEHEDMVRYIKDGEKEKLKKLVGIHHDYPNMPRKEEEIRQAYPEYFPKA